MLGLRTDQRGMFEADHLYLDCRQKQSLRLRIIGTSYSHCCAIELHICIWV